MKFFVKTITMISAAFFLFVLQAEALTIDFLYQTPTDNSGKTSRFVAADNQNVSGSGFIIETFDKQGSKKLVCIPLSLMLTSFRQKDARYSSRGSKRN